jgi:DNA-3-methyladenine glycosylase II
MKISCQADIEEGVNFLIKTHPLFAELVPQCGQIPLRLTTGDFEGLAAIIVSQQVSRASANAIFNRLKEQINPLTAEHFLKAGENAWQNAGLSRPKQRTLNAVCAAVIDRRLNLDQLSSQTPQTAMKALTDIKGIGPWTAEIYLMFCAGHRDIFPACDLALQEAIKLGLGFEDRPGEKLCRQISEDWSPWRSVAARILWDYYRVVKSDALPVE